MVAPLSSDAIPEITRAVIPAAGLGTRLQPLTYAFPKELLPVGRRPVLAHIAAELRGAGITDALFIVSDRKPQIKSYFGELFRGDMADDRRGEISVPLGRELPPLRCSYIVQSEQRGLGDALLYAQDWAQEQPFVVAFGDCMIEAEDSGAPLRRLIAAFRKQRGSAAVLCETVAREKVSRYGVLDPVIGGAVVPETPFAVRDIVEKPSPEKAPSTLVVAARWVLSAGIFARLREVLPDARGELNLTDAVRALCGAGEAFWAVPLLSGEYRRDIGNFETFFAAVVRAALRDPEYGAAIRRVAAEELARPQRS